MPASLNGKIDILWRPLNHLCHRREPGHRLSNTIDWWESGNISIDTDWRIELMGDATVRNDGDAVTAYWYAPQSYYRLSFAKKNRGLESFRLILQFDGASWSKSPPRGSCLAIRRKWERGLWPPRSVYPSPILIIIIQAIIKRIASALVNDLSCFYSRGGHPFQGTKYK